MTNATETNVNANVEAEAEARIIDAASDPVEAANVVTTAELMRIFQDMPDEMRTNIAEAFAADLAEAEAFAEKLDAQTTAEVARLEALRNVRPFYAIVADMHNTDTPEAIRERARESARKRKAAAAGRLARKPASATAKKQYGLYLDGKLSTSVNTLLEAEAVANSWRSNAKHAGKSITLRNNVTGTERTFA